MLNNPKISVIVPVYNVEKYLRQCLDSLLGQTLRDIEIVLVDDCGSDNSMAIAQKFAEKDSRIKIVSREKNGGLSAARNTGLQNSSAPYAMFCDGDDSYEPTMCEKMFEGIESGGADIATCGIRVTYEPGTEGIKKSDDRYYKVKFSGLREMNDDIRQDTDCSVCNKIFRRDFLDSKEIRFPEGLNYEDAYFVNAYFAAAKDIFFVNEYLYKYLRRSGSIMSDTFTQKTGVSIDHLKIAILLNDFMKRQGIAEKNKDFMGSFFFSCLDFALRYESDPASRTAIYDLADDFITREGWHREDYPTSIAQMFEVLKNRPAAFRTTKRMLGGLVKKIKTPNRKEIRLLGLPVYKVKYEQKKASRYLCGLKVYSNSMNDDTLGQKMFSVKNKGDHKVFCLFGIKFKVKKEKKSTKSRLKELEWHFNEHNKIINVSTLNAFLDNNQAQHAKKPLDIDSLLSSARNIMGIFYDEALNNVHKYFKILFSGQLHRNSFDSSDKIIDLAYLWGINYNVYQSQVISRASQLNIPVLICEDGFLRSACTAANETIASNYRAGVSFTIDDLTSYYDATRPSRVEIMLNDEKFILTDEQKNRARSCIDRIVETHLTKYNHQPIYTPDIGRKNVKKVLVVDQSYGDMSITKGMANDESFKNMLESAIKDNPDADIIVKTHPDTMAGKGGYYKGLRPHGNVYTMTSPINPISLIKYCDKVYVCTTQLGLEALVCGKETHVFGMPFYAGWGLTHDRQKCERRTNTRTLEELFYIAYIAYSRYVNPKTRSRCEIEEAMDYLLELREEYFGTCS